MVTDMELNEYSWEKPLYVMIVDDDEDDIHFMKNALLGRVAHASFTTHSNGVDAINTLRSLRGEQSSQSGSFPHLIVLDLNMPVQDGFATLSQLKNDPDFAAIPVIVITSSYLDEDQRRCMLAGSARFVTKPMTIEQYAQLANETMNVLCAG